MRKILCFGDSNTFGFIPGSGLRYDDNTRWTSVLKKDLSNDFEVIEAGCNNRNCYIDNPDSDELTGYKVLPKYLETEPDIVVLALGINDLQKFYNPTIEQAQSGIDSMVKTILKTGAKVILIAPPILNDDVLKGYFSFQFDKISVEKSKHLPTIYKMVAEENKCHYIDLNKYVKVSPIDGLHYSAESHNIIAQTISDYIKREFCSETFQMHQI